MIIRTLVIIVMDNSLQEMHLQGPERTMGVVFIKTNIQTKMIDTTTLHCRGYSWSQLAIFLELKYLLSVQILLIQKPLKLGRLLVIIISVPMATHSFPVPSTLISIF